MKQQILKLYLLLTVFVAHEVHAYTDSSIKRTIDVSKTIRAFPKLPGYFNTSLQKVPAPVIASVAGKAFGRPEIIRCWLNLDEMWDYRTRKYDFNFRPGIDKYKNIKEKHRETWDSQEESFINYYDYLKAFSASGKYIMLAIRRYERDVLNEKLPVSMSDWKMIFKEGLKHYKQRYPNIRYVEVGNEYEQINFMAATDEEYYKFYRLGYEAVNEINEELSLTGDQKILVGGPVPVGAFVKRIDRFTEQFSSDTNPKKQLDFLSWHEYTEPVLSTAFRESEIRNILRRHKLNEYTPLFVTEHAPVHFDKDLPGQSQINAANLVRTLYYASLYSPNICIFPWVLYHKKEEQTRFMWLSGPNKQTTPADSIQLSTIGASMKLLSMHSGKEIIIENNPESSQIVIGSQLPGKILLEAVNYAASPQNVELTIKNAAKLLNKDKVFVKQYIIDSTYRYVSVEAGLPVSREFEIDLNNNNDHTLSYKNLGENSIIAWEISATNGSY
jgi:hypothetical protein